MFAAFPFKGVALQYLPQVSYTEDFKAFPSKGVALRGSFKVLISKTLTKIMAAILWLN